MAEAKQTSKRVKRTVDTWQCDECEAEVLMDGSAPVFCAECGAEFESTESME